MWATKCCNHQPFVTLKPEVTIITLPLRKVNVRVGVTKVVVLASLLSLSLRAPAQQTQTGRLPAVVTDTEVILPADARMIAAARVTRVAFHPQGRLVLLVREEPADPLRLVPTATSGASILVYDSRSQRIRSIVAQSAEQTADGTAVMGGAVSAITWLPGSDTALAAATVRPIAMKQGTTPPPTTYNLLYIDAARGTARTLTSEAALFQFIVSPRAPAALLLTEKSGGKHDLRIISKSGKIGEALPVGEPGEGTETWDATGETAYVAGTQVEGNGSVKQRAWYAINTRTGRVTRQEQQPQSTPGAARDDVSDAALPCRLVQTNVVTARGKVSRALKPLWLSSNDPKEPFPVLIAPDAEQGKLLSDLSSILYLQNEALYAVPLRRVSRKEFDVAQEAAYRARAMENAFSIGSALQQYAEKNEGAFPASGSDLAQTLAPYLQDASALSNPLTGAPGFVYSFAGGKITDPNALGTTALGYIAGTNGQAMLYANGNVQWQWTKGK